MTQAKKVNPKKLRPYGDIMDDGTTQVSFTLPVEPSPEAREAATQIMQKMGFDQIKLATMEKAGEGFCFFVFYGNTRYSVDFTKIKVVKVESKKRSRDEIDELVREKVGRKIKVVGACTGFDAHTVGIDAIINMKGYHGDYGLERYQWFDAKNLGAQVLNDDLLKAAERENADVVLVSKVVTQHNIHLRDMKDLIRRAEEMGLREKMVFVAGGPRITHPMALECGFDAGFGAGTKPSDVASYIFDQVLARKEGGAGKARAKGAKPAETAKRAVKKVAAKVRGAIRKPVSRKRDGKKKK